MASAVVVVGAVVLGVSVGGPALANPQGGLPSPTASFASQSFLGRFQNVVPGPSTVPANGDVNPYGVAVVDRSTGSLVAGGVLVSNFNDQANAQGTGTTIVQVHPDGSVSQFAQIDQSSTSGPCPGGIGLTTALSILPGGWVVVGSLPTTANGPSNAGTPQGIGSGCLLVLNSTGQLVETWAGGAINGPWDMTSSTVLGQTYLFVSNVLNGTVAANAGIPADQPGNVVNGGTVLRIKLDLDPGQNPRIVSQTVIGTGFAERTDPAAVVVGPTGVGLDDNGVLYVSDSVNNRIAAIPDALTRSTTFGVRGGLTVSTASVLNDPLGMAVAPNGDLLTVNGNNGLIVETSPFGRTVAAATLDDSGPPPRGAGDLFGLVVTPGGRGIWFVDDGTNTLNLFF